MKIFITGNSRGIGLSVSKKLQTVGYNVVGGSRENGYDIEKTYDYVIESIMNCDVFINNAYVHKYQTKLLKDVFDLWKYKDKLIINIGSCASDMKIDNRDRLKQYPSNKIEQDDFIKTINVDYCLNGYKENVKCKVTNVKMGYVLTDFPSLYDKRYFPTLDTSYVADTIYWIISQPKNVCVRDISLHSTSKPIWEHHD